jgi:3-deoxy-D-manno-octulosonic-acid transferase
MQKVLAGPELFLMQTAGDARRIQLLGASEERIAVTGNLKYDVAPPQGGALFTWLQQEIRRQERWPVIFAGSVVADEEEEVLAAFDVVQRKWRHALLVLAPRKPERFVPAASLVEERGWTIVRRSVLDLAAPLDDSADVLLLDSLGELASLYGVADAVFVGGSLVAAGGHNILEPAWFSKPPVFGPSMENFRQMAEEFVNAGAGVQVHSSGEMARVWVELLEDASRRESMAVAARALVDRNQGATQRTLQRLLPFLTQAPAPSAKASSEVSPSQAPPSQPLSSQLPPTQRRGQS